MYVYIYAYIYTSSAPGEPAPKQTIRKEGCVSRTCVYTYMYICIGYI